MITLLRKIRQSLIESNSTRKYLFYAIGEIALVVIGILIALQINNWNENNKLKANEIKIYKEIVDDLEACKADIEQDLENYRELWDATVYVRNHIAERRPFADSLMYYMSDIDWDQQFYPKKSAFESLQSIGLYTLSNDSIRLAITDLYQLWYARLEVQGREGDSHRIANLIRPFFNKHFKVIKIPEPNRYRRRIADYNAFLNDQQLLEALHHMLELRRFKIRRYQFCLEGTEWVLSMVREEIDRLEG